MVSDDLIAAAEGSAEMPGDDHRAAGHAGVRPERCELVIGVVPDYARHQSPDPLATVDGVTEQRVVESHVLGAHGGDGIRVVVVPRRFPGFCEQRDRGDVVDCGVGQAILSRHYFGGIRMPPSTRTTSAFI